MHFLKRKRQEKLHIFLTESISHFSTYISLFSWNAIEKSSHQVIFSKYAQDILTPYLERQDKKDYGLVARNNYYLYFITSNQLNQHSLHSLLCKDRD